MTFEHLDTLQHEERRSIPLQEEKNTSFLVIVVKLGSWVVDLYLVTFFVVVGNRKKYNKEQLNVSKKHKQACHTRLHSPAASPRDPWNRTQRCGD